jgi:hypothetical protein
VIACYLGIAGPGEPVAASDAAAAEWVDPADLGRFTLAPNIAVAVSRAKELLTRSPASHG